MSTLGPLIVMLPGAYDTPADLVEHGFDAMARSAGCRWQAHPTDLTAIADGRLIHRIHQEVIEPARARGERRILLGGISIGGLSTLTYHDTYPDMVDGLLLIAPYPGNRTITRTIQDAGGVRDWTPGALTADEGELRGWRALKSLATRAPTSVWLGYGESDRFVAGHHLMADALPNAQVVTAPGGHDWPTWRHLWQALLARMAAA